MFTKYVNEYRNKRTGRRKSDPKSSQIRKLDHLLMGICRLIPTCKIQPGQKARRRKYLPPYELNFSYMWPCHIKAFIEL